MKLSESDVQGQFIDEVLEDSIIIAGENYKESLYIADNMIYPWGIQLSEELTMSHLVPLINTEPQLIVIGISAFTPLKQMHFWQNNMHTQLLQQGIGCEVSSLSAACNTWNILQGDQRRVCLALIRERV